MNRRDILKYYSLVLPATVGTGCAGPEDKTGKIIEDYFRQIIDTGSTPGRIAQEYRAANPGVQTADPVALFYEKFVPDGVDTPGTLSVIVDSKIRQDFIDGNILQVDGWYLSETEILVCELAAQYREQTTNFFTRLFRLV